MTEKRKPKRRDVEQDIAYLTTEGEWFIQTVEMASMAQCLARAHGRRLLEIAERLRNAIATEGRTE
jgi:hypothetical protein